MSMIPKPETMIPFKNEISVKYENHHFPLKPVSKSLVLEAKPKLWSAKYFLHEESDKDDYKDKAKVGDGVTILCIFGNYGPTTWKTDGHTTTVEDFFEVAKGMHLIVKDINVSCFYELWVLNYGHEHKCKELRKGDILFGDKTYILQLRKKCEHGPATPYFDIPCYSVNSFAVTFLTGIEHCEHKEKKCHEEPKECKEPKKEIEPKEDKEPKCPREKKEDCWGKISSYSIGEDIYR